MKMRVETNANQAFEVERSLAARLAKVLTVEEMNEIAGAGTCTTTASLGICDDVAHQ